MVLPINIDLGEVLVNGRRVQGIKIIDRPDAPGLVDNPGREISLLEKSAE